jgi:hypothetical protein
MRSGVSTSLMNPRVRPIRGCIQRALTTPDTTKAMTMKKPQGSTRETSMRLLVGQQSDQDATPVQRRQRKQVEDEHHDIDQDAALAHLDEEGLVDRRWRASR